MVGFPVSGMPLSPLSQSLTAVQGQLIVPMVPPTHISSSAAKSDGHMSTIGSGFSEKELHSK